MARRRRRRGYLPRLCRRAMGGNEIRPSPLSLEFIISTHSGLEGARLSRSGDFGNLPFPSIRDAELEAERRASGRPFTIRREAFSAPPRIGKKS